MRNILQSRESTRGKFIRNRRSRESISLIAHFFDSPDSKLKSQSNSYPSLSSIDKKVLYSRANITQNKDTYDGGFPVENSTYPSITDDEIEDFVKKYSFRWYSPVFFFISIASYISDVVSDCYLTYVYFIQGDYYWSYLTLAFTLCPSLIMTLFSLTWYILDHKKNLDPPRSCFAWSIRILFHLLQLSPLVRTFDALVYGYKSRNQELPIQERYRLLQLMLFEDSDSAMLRLIESFTESAPQLLLQLYIQFTQPIPDKTTTWAAQLVSILCSWLSLAWCLSAYQITLRNSRHEKDKMRLSGTILHTLWKAGMLASRILSLALFAAAYRGIHFAVTVLFHWTICVLLLVWSGTTFCSPIPNTFPEIFFDFVLGAIYIFDIINVREGSSRIWYTLCYSLIFVENTFYCVFWYLRPYMGDVYTGLGTKIDLEAAKQGNLTKLPGILQFISRESVLIFAIMSFLLGLGFMASYYIFAHPSGGIRLWIPIKELCKSIYEDETKPPSRALTLLEIPIECDPKSSKYMPNNHDHSIADQILNVSSSQDSTIDFIDKSDETNAQKSDQSRSIDIH